MFNSRFKLLLLLASAYVLPLANGRCSPYLKDRPQETSPEPEKCWICENPNDGFTGGDSKPFPDWENESTKSWNNFYCKYTRNEGQDENDNPYKPSTIYCPYNEKGELRLKDRRCPSRARQIPNCTLTRPYSGPPKVCCGSNCTLETDQCITCPSVEDVKYVDVTAGKNTLICVVEGWTRGLTGPVYKYDAQTGAPLSVDPPPYAKRDGCMPKPVSVPGADCPTGPAHDQCVEEAKQNEYRNFDTWNRCWPQADYCKERSMSRDCWACPMIEGTDAVDEKDYASVPGYCTYYKRNASGVLESANTVCGYNLGLDGTRYPSLDGKNNALICPSRADKDLTCQRLKDAQKN